MVLSPRRPLYRVPHTGQQVILLHRTSSCEETLPHSRDLLAVHSLLTQLSKVPCARVACHIPPSPNINLASLLPSYHRRECTIALTPTYFLSREQNLIPIALPSEIAYVYNILIAPSTTQPALTHRHHCHHPREHRRRIHGAYLNAGRFNGTHSPAAQGGVRFQLELKRTQSHAAMKPVKVLPMH